MTVDREVLAERSAAVERHLRRVAERLPAKAEDLKPDTDAADAVVLHLWQATQIVIDTAVGLCVRLGLGSPGNYAEAFRRLAAAGRIDSALADRLAGAAGFRNVVAHEYGTLDLNRVHRAASEGPRELREFLKAAARSV